MEFVRAIGEPNGAEEQARRIQDEIERQLAARTADLHATIQQLRIELEERQRAEAALRLLAKAHSIITPSLDYESMLQAVAQLAVPFLCDYCIIDLLPADGVPRRSAVAHRDPAQQARLSDLWRRYQLAANGTSPIALVVRTHQPLVCGSVPASSIWETLRDDDLRSLIDALGAPSSWMTVPLLARGRMLGTLSFARTQPVCLYGSDDLALAEELARRATLAIEQAELYKQAQEVAVLQERQRLAHDLHDAVTQMLFSASLIAEVLPRMWERDHDKGRQHLEDLRLLTRGALAEMRALLLELRPAALTSASLGDLLQQLAEALTGRTRISVALTIDNGRRAVNPSLPPDVQIALYRIAQEALSNISKHAGARRVAVQLRVDPAQVELRISDDGKGFDPAQIAADHFGLSIMRERVAAIGGALSIDSHLGQGTAVTVRWPE